MAEPCISGIDVHTYTYMLDELGVAREVIETKEAIHTRFRVVK